MDLHCKDRPLSLAVGIDQRHAFSFDKKLGSTLEWKARFDYERPLRVGARRLVIGLNQGKILVRPMQRFLCGGIYDCPRHYYGLSTTEWLPLVQHRTTLFYATQTQVNIFVEPALKCSRQESGGGSVVEPE